jgi:CBS domain-containing protein
MVSNGTGFKSSLACHPDNPRTGGAAMITAGDILKEKNAEMVYVDPEQAVSDVIRLMVARKIGAILIKDDQRIVGIWTERDLLKSLAASGFDAAATRIGDVMTRKLHTVSIDTSLIRIEEMFLGLFIRHLPVEKDGEIVGMISIGDVLRTSLLEKDRKIKELNSMASWQYYENWGWTGKKK